MKDRAGFFAGCADVLTEMCAYYVVAGIAIMAKRGWGVHLFWLLLCAAACMWVFAALLKKPRSVPFLALVTGGLFLACMAVFLLASSTPPRFGYVFVLAVGGGMAVGLPLHYSLNRPTIQKHLTRLDILLIALVGLLLCRKALGIDAGTVALMTAVLFMDAASAVGLRMSDAAGDSGDAFKAVMIALGGAAALALVIGLFTAVFSRSAGAVGGILHGIGSVFAAIGGQIERFFRWIASLVGREDSFEAIPLEGEIPSVTALEQDMGGEISVDASGIGVAAAVLILAAISVAVILLRKKTLSRKSAVSAAVSDMTVRRTGGSFAELWQAVLAKLRFLWMAFVLRDTPAGLMVRLEWQGKRIRRPRRSGETMAHYIRRMDAPGALGELADALDRQYYAGEKGKILSARKCRDMRRYIARLRANE